MAIRVKVVLLLGISLILALFISGLALFGANKVLDRALKFSDSTKVDVALARTLAEATTTIKADPISPDTGPLLKRVNKQVHASFVQARSRAQKDSNAEFATALDQAEHAWDAYYKQSVNLFNMATTDPASAIGMVESVYKSKFIPFKQKFNQAIVLGLKRGDRLQSDIASSIHSQRQLILIPLIITALLLIGLAAAFIILLGRSVYDFLRHSERLSDGDLTIRFDERKRDEIGQIGQAVNRFLDPFVRTLDGARHAADESDRVVEHLRHVMNEAERNIVAQDKETEQMVTAVEQLSGSFRQVAGNAARASETAEHGEEIVLQGTQTGQQTIAALNSIDQAVTTTSEMMGKLDMAISQVADVTRVIQGISEQTTLLALNAAIEAARAGVQGRGFAVVADEVKQLSDRTKASTIDITNIVQTVQASTRDVRQTLDEARGAVAQGVDAGESMGTLLADIDQSMQSVATMLREIATSTEEQSAVAVDITDRIERVAIGSKNMREQTGAVTTVMHDLGQANGQLHRYLEAFRINAEDPALNEIYAPASLASTRTAQAGTRAERV